MIKGSEYSEAIRKSLRGTAARLKAKLNEVYTDEFALATRVSDAYPVVVPDDIQERYNVSRYGRKEVREEKVILTVAPKMAHYRMDYLSQDATMIDPAENWAQKGYGTFNQNPVLDMVKVLNSKAHQYEYQLFKKLTGPLVIVNPSTSTLWNTKDMDVYIAVPERGKEAIEREYFRMGRQPRYLQEGSRKINHYYGIHASSPPPNARFPWYRFQPNPNQVGLYESWKALWDREGVDVSYMTTRFHSYRIENEVPWTRLSPKSTDTYLDAIGRKYMLETNVAIYGLARDTKVYEGAGYLDGQLPTPTEAGYIEDSEYVWDVPGPGTFFSRRGLARKYAKDVGKQLKPISESGTIPLGLQTEQLQTSILHRSHGGALTLALTQSEERPPPNCPMGVLVTQNSLHDPLLTIPGLYYTKASYDPAAHKVYTSESRYFFGRTMEEVMQRVPLVIAHFSLDSSLPQLGKGPSIDWIRLDEDIRESAKREKSIAQIIRDHGWTEYTIRLAVRGRADYSLAQPHKLFWEKWRRQDRKSWVVAPIPRGKLDYILVRTDKYIPEVSTFPRPVSGDLFRRLKMLNRGYYVTEGKVHLTGT